MRTPTKPTTRTLSALSIFFSASLLAACGGGGSDGDDDPGIECGFTGELTGGVTASLAYGGDSGCGGSGFEDRLALSLGVSERYIVYLSMTGVTAGSTPAAAPASLEVLDTEASPEASWITGDTDCTLAITTNAPDELGYNVVGTGTCGAPAVGRDGNQAPDIAIVGTFTFSAGAAWPE
jgi:hypothetical protein